MQIKTFIRNVSLIGTLVLSLVSCHQVKKTNCLNPSGFEIHKGVNLSHWLSQDFGWAPKYSYINQNDIKFIDSIGYDHVRIPIDEMELWDEQGMQIDEAFNQLNNCLNWCHNNNLRAIVDLHIVRSHHFNAGNEGAINTLWTDTIAQAHFINLWIQLSDVLKKYPTNEIAYEILNEAVAPDHNDWNKLINNTVRAIRKLEPDRVLVIGANMWQMAPNLQYLNLPEGDKNIILSFHTYTPMAFTHYKANWTPLKDYLGPVHYPGQIITNNDYTQYFDTTIEAMVNMAKDAREIYNKQKLFEVFKSGLEFAKSKNLQLYCGEFGCVPTVDRKDRLAYYSDMISVLEENNIAWCNWEYKGDFGIYYFDMEKKISVKPDFELIQILLKNTN